MSFLSTSQTLDLSKCGEVRADVWMFEKAHNIGTYFFSGSSGVNMMKEWAEDDILMVTKLVEFPAPYTWWRSHFWTFPHFVSWADCSYCQGCCSLPLSTFLFTPVRLWGLKPWIVDWDCDWDLEGVSHDSPNLLNYTHAVFTMIIMTTDLVFHFSEKWQVINNPLFTDVFPDPLCIVNTYH